MRICVSCICLMLLIAGLLIIQVGSDRSELTESKDPLESTRSTLYVGPNETYWYIMAAVWAANPGDTIVVLNGTYDCDVYLNKTLTLTGEGIGKTFLNNGGTGTGITINAPNCYISGFTIQYSGPGWWDAGIRINSDFNTIESVNASYNAHGILITNCMVAYIRDSEFEMNAYDGIRIVDSDSIHIHDSSGNYNENCSISLYKSWSTWVNNCSLSSNYYHGLSIGFESQSNYITNNTFRKNTMHGVNIGSSTSDYNTLFHNNFIDNNAGGNQALDDGDHNLWDHSLVGDYTGNYWSDWTSPDNNADGIVDIPYNISGTAGASDPYPLVDPIGLPPVTTVIYVDDDNRDGPWDGSIANPYEKISDAVQSATTGDTIRVFAGSYIDKILLDKTLTIIGNGTTDTHIYGYQEYVIRIAAPYCNISFLSLLSPGMGDSVGIYVVSNNNSISYCKSTGINIGIHIYEADENKIENNVFSHNWGSTGRGISLFGSDKNIIRNNICNVSRNTGMTLYHSNNNSIINNTCFNNTGAGIAIEWYCGDNLLYRNRFFGNNNDTIQAYDNSSSINYWNSASEGNYWPDWTSPDSNNDGIVDTPFNVNGSAGAIDYYPLIGNLSLTYPPVITTSSDPWAYVDQLYQKNYIAYDPDTGSEGLVWSMSTNAAWLTFSETQVLQGTPSFEDVGSYWVNISVTDGSYWDHTNFTITVLNLNVPPVITTTDITDCLEDELYWVDYNAIDEDPLTWSLVTNASFLTIDSETGILSGTPTNDDVGVYEVNVTVTDGMFIDRSYFMLTVVNVNDPPTQIYNFTVIIIDANPHSPKIENLTIQVIAPNVTDIDGDEIIYTWDFGDNTGNISGQSVYHTFASSGTYTITLYYSDGYVTFSLSKIVEIKAPDEDEDEDEDEN